MKKMNPVVHFEMPTSDVKRTSEFYSKVFGWGMQETGPDMGNYLVVSTSETGEDGQPKNPGSINGGFYLKTKGMPTEPSVVIAVDDIKAHIKIIKDAGGEIVGDIMDIPGIGQYVPMLDPDKNRVGILQPSPMMEKK